MRTQRPAPSAPPTPTPQLSRIKRDLCYHARSDELVDGRQLAVNEVRRRALGGRFGALAALVGL
jgi:hypothetical protein